MRIVSLGASGATGRQLVTAALNRGHQVVAVVRRPEALEGLANSNLSVRQGDIQQPSTIASACEGADGVISTLGFSRGGPWNILSAAARAVLDARPQRVVWMGSFGVGVSRYKGGHLYDLVLRFALKDGFDDKALADQLIAGPTTTIVHPTVLTNAECDTHPTTVIPLDELPKSWHFIPPRVSRRAVAAAMLDEFAEARYQGRVVVVS
jgi:uncharacterized protein